MKSPQNPNLFTAFAPAAAQVTRVTRFVCSLMLISMLASLPGCGDSGSTSTATPDASPTATANVDAGPKLKYPVPNGTNQELLDFINNLAQQEPQGTSGDEQTADLAEIMKSRIVAADRILDGKDKVFAAVAARTKLESMRVLVMTGQLDYVDQFAGYAQSLVDSGNAELTLVGDRATLQAKLDSVMIRGAEPQIVVDQLKSLLVKGPLDKDLFHLSFEAGAALADGRHPVPASEIFRVTGEAYLDHEDPILAEEANISLKRAALVQFQQQFGDVIQDPTNDGTEFLTKALPVIDESLPPQALQMVNDLAQMAERSSKIELAHGIFEKLDAVLAKLDTNNPILAINEDVKRSLARTGLLGSTIELQGESADGEPFDLADLEGKVILVDFWATWCGPCVAEIPNVLKAYGNYHDKGFDVVAVNLDDDPELVNKFLEQRQLPWTNVLNESTGEEGQTAADRMGITSIPFMFVIDQSGKVAALHTRGAALDKFLEDRLGPVEAFDGDMELEIEVEGDNSGDAPAE